MMKYQFDDLKEAIELNMKELHHQLWYFSKCFTGMKAHTPNAEQLDALVSAADDVADSAKLFSSKIYDAYTQGQKVQEVTA